MIKISLSFFLLFALGCSTIATNTILTSYDLESSKSSIRAFAHSYMPEASRMNGARGEVFVKRFRQRPFNSGIEVSIYTDAQKIVLWNVDTDIETEDFLSVENEIESRLNEAGFDFIKSRSNRKKDPLM